MCVVLKLKKGPSTLVFACAKSNRGRSGFIIAVPACRGPALDVRFILQVERGDKQSVDEDGPHDEEVRAAMIEPAELHSTAFICLVEGHSYERASFERLFFPF